MLASSITLHTHKSLDNIRISTVLMGIILTITLVWLVINTRMIFTGSVWLFITLLSDFRLFHFLDRKRCSKACQLLRSTVTVHSVCVIFHLSLKGFELIILTRVITDASIWLTIIHLSIYLSSPLWCVLINVTLHIISHPRSSSFCFI